MMKNIAVDFGNTTIKAAIFDGNQKVASYGPLSQVELLYLLNQHADHRIGISTVSQASTHIYNLIDHKERLLLLSAKTPIPIKNDYKQPESLGMDRLALAVGANYLYPSADLIVIDAGTCITFDIVTHEATYLGGSIAPGLHMRNRAMHQFTTKLPLVKDLIPGPLLGQTTQECLVSGILFGTGAEIDGMIANYSNQFNKAILIMTGGDAPMLHKIIKNNVHLVPDLVLIGLNQIMNFNV